MWFENLSYWPQMIVALVVSAVVLIFMLILGSVLFTGVFYVLFNGLIGMVG